MPIYNYKGRDRTGKPVQGKMEAASRVELASKLRDMGYLVSAMTEEGFVAAVPSLVSRIARVKTEAILMFNVQLAALISAGITLIRSLRVLQRQVESGKLRDMLVEIIGDVEGGSALSAAMRKHPTVFPKFYVSMIAAGEASGELPRILTRLAGYMEEQANLRGKLKNALMYPVVLSVVGLVIIILISTIVLPQFVTIFEQSGVPVPSLTMLIFHVGTAIRNYWYAIIAAIAGLVVLFRLYSRSEKGNLAIDGLKLEIPLFGKLITKAAVARFSRTLSMLISTGVPVIQALEIAGATLSNEVLARSIKGVSESVKAGKGLAGPLRLSGHFPPLTVQMVATGEETGELDKLLGKTADYYDMEVDHAIKRLSVLIEPVFLIVMGLTVGLIMASIMIPLFRMVNVVSVR